MEQHEFLINQSLLDQLTQPILFLEDGKIVRWNQAAEKVVATASPDLADHLTIHAWEHFQGLEDGATMAVTLELNHQLWEGTITKSAHSATLVLTPPLDEDTLPLDTLPSISNAIRKPLIQMHQAADFIIPILEEFENKQYQEMTANLTQGLYRLLRLSSNMFDYALFSEDKRPLTFEKVIIEPYFEDMFLRLTDLCSTCEIYLETSLTVKNLVGYMDGQQVFRMVLNLVSNAMAVTKPQGTITLDVVAMGRQLKIRVGDQGAGMAPKVLQHRFHQFTNGQLHEKDGTSAGFGLALASQIAQAHGGNLLFSTTPSQGTVVMAVLSITREHMDFCASKTQLDYTGGLDICRLELAEVLPAKDFDSREL